MTSERNQHRSTRRTYRWTAIIAAAQAKGTWLLHPDLANVPRRTVESITLRRHPALEVAGGRLRARAVNVYQTSLGHEKCDVWVLWVPTTEAPPPGDEGASSL